MAMTLSSQSKNIRYQSEAIRDFFNDHRNKWEDFYPSEKWAFERLAQNPQGFGKVLDVGCALGGLGVMLSDRFKIDEYKGVDINQPAITRAQTLRSKFKIPVSFECEDILKLDTLKGQQFDTVFSLSCADWNVDTERTFHRCWEFVKPAGNFVISIRLTHEEGINDITKSHQPLAFDKKGNVIETANYVVFNYRDFLRLIEGFNPRPDLVSGYGYWGSPASNAITPYKELVFGVFIVQKSQSKERNQKIKAELNLPLDLFTK